MKQNHVQGVEIGLATAGVGLRDRSRPGPDDGWRSPEARRRSAARLTELAAKDCSRADFPSHGDKLCRNPDAKQEAKHWRW